MKLRVLLVDDEPNVLETLSALLDEEMEVVTSTSALRALLLMDTTPFDVVCSDYETPGMTGVELLQRASATHPETGTLLVTGAAQYLQTHSGGQHYVLLKPVDPIRFVAIVRQLGQIAQMRRPVG